MEASPRHLAGRRPDLAVALGTCGASDSAFASTTEHQPLDETIGKARAVEALEMGLSLRSPGYRV